MDQLSDSLGQLSTNAKEWRPTSSSSSSPYAATTTTINTYPQQVQQQQQQHPPQSIPQMTSVTSVTSTTASASGINVNASNWVPQSMSTSTSSNNTSSNVYSNQQQQQQQYPTTTKEIQHEHLDQLQQELVEEQQQQQLENSIPKGSIPPPHQQTFTMNNPISLPLPKSLINDNTNTALGGSGGATSGFFDGGRDKNNDNDRILPNHYLAKLYQLYHVDCSNQMDPDDERYKAIPQSFVNAMPLETDATSSSSSSTNTTSINNTTAPNTTASTIPSTTTATNTATTKKRSISSTTSQTRSSFGYPSSVFKVTSVDDGRLYCLRRFDNVKCVNSRIASQVSNMWNHAVRNVQSTQHHFNNHHQHHRRRGGGPKNQQQQQQQLHVMNHPGLVRFYKAFYMNQNRALFFIHEYYPNALTLREALFRLKRGDSGKLNLTTSSSNGGVGMVIPLSSRTFHPLSEGIIWSYITQLVTAIKCVHLGDLAVRVLQLNHILVTSDVGSGFVDDSSIEHSDGIMRNLMTNRVRLRINCIGVVDALEYESRKDVEECQKEDMRCLGRIIMSLATGMEIGSDVDDETLRKCDSYMSQAYSVELYNLTMALMTKKRMDRLGNVMQVDPPNIHNVCRVVGERALDELDSVHVMVDKMDEALAHEYESGRGLRLLMKLGFVNERPEFGVDTRWSESGDSYGEYLIQIQLFSKLPEGLD